MEHPDDIICQKFLANPAINPRTGKSIKEGKVTYNDLVKFCAARNFNMDKLSLKSIKSSNNIPTPTPIKISLPTSNPIKSSNTNLINTSPNDLLELYLTNNDIAKTLDDRQFIKLLDKKYNTQSNTDSFTIWYKFYSITQIDKHLKYLYTLENRRYVDDIYVTNLDNGNFVIKTRMIYILLDWMYEIVSKVLGAPRMIYCYASTLLFIFLSKNKIHLRKKLQLYGSLCIYFSTLFLDEHALTVENLVEINSGTIDSDQIEDGLVEIFTSLEGQFIYPSPVFFIDQENSDVLLLTILASSIISLSTYKSSLVAQTCIYMITGEHGIYTSEEMSYVCQIISNVLNIFEKSPLRMFKERSIISLKNINYPCGKNDIQPKLYPLKYDEPWHLGNIEELEVLGEGTYGKVTKIKRLKCGTNYVIKATRDVNAIHASLLEIGILKLLANQSNIISICGFNYYPERVETILPAAAGSIRDLVKNGRLDKSKYRKYFTQILTGIKQCHDHDIIHRDIKTDNIVYNAKTDNMLIIDFGLSVCFQSVKTVTNTYYANTISYRPIECLIYENEQYGQEIDIWAAGCVFYYMLSRKYVVYDFSRIGEITDIFTLLGTPTDKIWPGISTKINELNLPIVYGKDLNYILRPYTKLILACLTMDPKQRPTVDELLKMKY